MITFRKNAMQKMASAEDLDKTIVIIGTKSWITIFTIIVLAGVFLTWSVMANISSNIKALGIFLPQQGLIIEVKSNTQGTIKQIYVKVGDIIEKGGLIAELSLEENKRKLQQAKEQLKTENELFKQIKKNINKKNETRKKIRKEQIERINQQIGYIKEEVKNNKEILDQRLQAFQNRDITRNALTIARETYFRSVQQLDNLVTNKQETIYADTQSKQQDEVQMEKIKQNIQTLKDSVDNIEKSLNITKIYAPIAGRITEIKHIQGANVQATQTIANLVSSKAQYYARAEKNLEFIAYVNIINGKKVKIGTEVNVIVDGYDRNTYGFIKGTVKNISNFPVSGAGILSKLGNRSLVNDFTRQGSVYEIKVRLLQHSESKNRLLWSSQNGQDIEKIEIGTLGTAEFVLEKEKPIAKAIPAIKRFF